MPSLDEQFWWRTNEYQYQERIALAKAIEEQGVQVNELPEEVKQRLAEVVVEEWEEGVVPPEITMDDIYRSVVPYTLVMIGALALIMIFPAIATWLPDRIF